MNQSIRRFSVLIASPSDTEEERKTIREIIEHVNRDHGTQEGYLLVPIMWETDASPGVGSDAQDVINRQLKDYDIFVGLLSARFGTPTKRANSGTEEEFCNAFERYVSTPSSIRLLFYFRNTSVKVHDIEALGQALYICQFRIHLQQLGVFYQQYDTPTDLGHKLRGDLPKCVREMMSGPESHKAVPEPLTKQRTVEMISRGDWTGVATKRYPQGASYLNLVLVGNPAASNASSIVIGGHLHTSSPYFRFGFKLLPLNGRPFGEGSVQTDGPNLVVHLAKDHQDGPLYLTAYYNGRRSEPFRKELFPYAGERDIDLALVVVRDGSVQLRVDGTFVWESYVNRVIQDRVLLVAWGDYFDFEVHLRQIHIDFMQV